MVDVAAPGDRGGARIHDRPAHAKRRAPIVATVVLMTLAAAVLAMLFATHVW